METLLARVSVGISELKLNPTAVLEQAEGEAVAVLNRNKPVAYLVPAEKYEQLLDRLEDHELGVLARAALAEPGANVKVSPDELRS